MRARIAYITTSNCVCELKVCAPSTLEQQPTVLGELWSLLKVLEAAEHMLHQTTDTEPFFSSLLLLFNVARAAHELAPEPMTSTRSALAGLRNVCKHKFRQQMRSVLAPRKRPQKNYPNCAPLKLSPRNSQILMMQQDWTARVCTSLDRLHSEEKCISASDTNRATDVLICCCRRFRQWVGTRIDGWRAQPGRRMAPRSQQPGAGARYGRNRVEKLDGTRGSRQTHAS